MATKRDDDAATGGDITSGGTGPQGRAELPGNDGPETFDPSNDERVNAAEEAERAKLRPQQPRAQRGPRLDETEPGGNYFHVEGKQLVGHDAHGQRNDDAEFPDDVDDEPRSRRGARR